MGDFAESDLQDQDMAWGGNCEAGGYNHHQQSSLSSSSSSLAPASAAGPAQSAFSSGYPPSRSTSASQPPQYPWWQPAGRFIDACQSSFSSSSSSSSASSGLSSDLKSRLSLVSRFVDSLLRCDPSQVASAWRDDDQATQRLDSAVQAIDGLAEQLLLCSCGGDSLSSRGDLASCGSRMVALLSSLGIGSGVGPVWASITEVDRELLREKLQRLQAAVAAWTAPAAAAEPLAQPQQAPATAMQPLHNVSGQQQPSAASASGAEAQPLGILPASDGDAILVPLPMPAPLDLSFLPPLPVPLPLQASASVAVSEQKQRTAAGNAEAGARTGAAAGQGNGRFGFASQPPTAYQSGQPQPTQVKAMPAASSVQSSPAHSTGSGPQWHQPSLGNNRQQQPSAPVMQGPWSQPPSHSGGISHVPRASAVLQPPQQRSHNMGTAPNPTSVSSSSTRQATLQPPMRAAASSLASSSLSLSARPMRQYQPFEFDPSAAHASRMQPQAQPFAPQPAHFQAVPRPQMHPAHMQQVQRLPQLAPRPLAPNPLNSYPQPHPQEPPQHHHGNHGPRPPYGNAFQQPQPQQRMPGPQPPPPPQMQMQQGQPSHARPSHPSTPFGAVTGPLDRWVPESGGHGMADGRAPAAGVAGGGFAIARYGGPVDEGGSNAAFGHSYHAGSSAHGHSAFDGSQMHMAVGYGASSSAGQAAGPGNHPNAGAGAYNANYGRPAPRQVVMLRPPQ